MVKLVAVGLKQLACIFHATNLGTEYTLSELVRLWLACKSLFCLICCTHLNEFVGQLLQELLDSNVKPCIFSARLQSYQILFVVYVAFKITEWCLFIEIALHARIIAGRRAIKICKIARSVQELNYTYC